MQNAPAMLAQKMMNRQAPYGPIGMVSQNMSGNKKVSSPYMSVSASVSPLAVGKYDVYVFNASGTFTVNALGPDPTEGSVVEYLVIAGGGGSQGDSSGGGGAGGYRTASGFSVTPQTYAVTVGAGAANDDGVNSSIGAALVSTGGGSGGSSLDASGGSGGGAYRDAVDSKARGTAVVGQGFNGGTVTLAAGAATRYAHAGGGGAGAVGGNGTITAGGNGGAGITSSITGTAVARGGGGGGASFDGATDYAGSATDGGGFDFGSNKNGTANTGGGAGPNGSGGSGVVIIRVRARA